MPVVELRVGHDPAPVFGSGLDAAANMRHALQHRALPRASGFHQMRRPRLGVDLMRRQRDGFEHAVSQIIDQCHQKVAAAHRRIANFQLQNLAGRVQGVQRIPVARIERGFFAVLFQVNFKSGLPFAGQQTDGFAQHQPHQIVVRVITARHLARKAGGLGSDAVDLGLVLVAVSRLHFMHQAVFEQPLVNAAQMRHGQVAVVDPAVQQVFGAARQGVDDRGHDGVGYVGALQQRRAGAVEQAAVVGGHANVIVALVDQGKSAFQVQPDAAHCAGKLSARLHLVAHLFAQAAHAVRRIAVIAHRQQVAVFGVKQKQQAVQKHQRGFAHFVEVVAGELRALELAITDFVRARMQVAARQRIGELRKNLFKHACAKVLRHFFFIQPRFVQRIGMKGATGVVPALRQKGAAAEKQVKQAQRVGRRDVVDVVLNALDAERGGQVDFKKFFGT